MDQRVALDSVPALRIPAGSMPLLAGSPPWLAARGSTDGAGQWAGPPLDAGPARELYDELREALRRDALDVYLQPIADPADGRIAGYEALLRWQHAARGLVLPDDFLPAAEASGLIVDVDRWVLRMATAHLRYWRLRGYEGWLAVNASVRSLEDPTFVAEVRHLARANPELQGHLRLERTESARFYDADAGAKALAAVRAVGVGVAIDDFGKGYTSFADLSRGGFDVLKIDRALLAGVDSNPEAEAIVRSVLVLGRALGVTVVAEGVEREAQRAWLAGVGGVLAQGYMVGRPVPMRSVRMSKGASV